MGAALRKLQQSEAKHLHTKSLCYNIVKNAPRVLLPHSEAEKRKLENFNFITRNSKTIGRICRDGGTGRVVTRPKFGQTRLLTVLVVRNFKVCRRFLDGVAVVLNCILARRMCKRHTLELIASHKYIHYFVWVGYIC